MLDLPEPGGEDDPERTRRVLNALLEGHTIPNRRTPKTH